MLKYSPIRSLLLLCCVAIISCKHFDEPGIDNSIPPAPTMTLADLREQIGDRRVTISEPIIVGGYVTTDDMASNFYRTLCIEDATAGVEIMAGIYDLHNIYPEGSYLSISLEGCAAGLHYGVLQIGTEATAHSNYPTDYFSSRILLDRHIRCYDLQQGVAPKPISFEELKLSLCGQLVNMQSLRFTWLRPSNESGEWSGYNIFADKQGHTIAVYTSNYASYASEPVPDGEVSITGILQYGKVDGEEMYIIKMRDEKDCIVAN